MMRPASVCLMIGALCGAGAVAQAHGQQQRATAGSATLTDIRKADFANFTYQSSLCSQEYGKQGIGKTVAVKNGEFKNKNVYFSVTADRIIYADVTGDGREEAVVPIDCGAMTANFSRAEIHVYTITDGRPARLAGITDKDLERDYRASYPDAESYWGINEEGVKVSNGTLRIDVLADGPHAAPQYVVGLEYRMTGDALRVVGKPQRTKAGR